MIQASQEMCSICGKSHPLSEYSYGNRDNRSYCRACNKAERTAYAKGGISAAKEFREALRRTWKA